MLQIPLLLSATPTEVELGPVVALPQGFWKFSAIGLVDTQLIIRTESKDLEVNDTVEGPVKTMVIITKPGTESKITLYAKRVISYGN